MKPEAFRVLLVEDNPGDARLIREYAAGGSRDLFDIDQCDALASAQAHLAHTTADVVLLDLGLPDSQGLDTLRGIRSWVPRLPIVVLTGLQDEETGLEAVKEGAQDYLTKDALTPALLTATLRYAIARQKIQEELRAERDFADAMVQTAQVVVLVLDSAGRILRFNHYFEELSGVSLDEARDKDWFETFFPKGDQASARALFAGALAGKQTQGNVNQIVTRNGECRWLEWYDKTLTDPTGEVTLACMAVDVTEKRRTERQQALVAEVLAILNRPNEWQALIADILDAIQAATDVEAAAIRIEQDGDFPYVAARGFPPEFVSTERSLVDCGAEGLPKRTAEGDRELACMCGNVICGRTDPTLPFFTENGSFWTNSTTLLLASTTEEERQSPTRNQCNAFGYESVALIPVRANDKTIGLLQMNDHRADQFDKGMIRFFEGLASSIGVAFKRQQAEARIKRLLARQTRINQLTLELGRSETLEEAFAILYKHVCELVDSEAFILSLYNGEAQQFTAGYVVTRGKVRDVSGFPSIPLEPEGRGTQSVVVRTGEPLYIPDWQEAMRRTQRHYRIEPSGTVSEGKSVPDAPGEEDYTRSALLVPMKVGGRVLGVLQVQSHRLGSYSEDDTALLSGLANVAAIAIQNADLYEKAEKDAEMLRVALEGTIQAFARATELRDPYTAGHQLRVARLSEAIAGRMGLGDGRIAGIRAAGLLHDSGKLSVPAEILAKPTQLTQIEFSIIRGHPQAGADLLHDIDFPWPLREFVLQHHERIDGSGYPQGLKGAETHVEAKILAVADVVEAMASHRPYRAALGIEKALEEISRNRGVLFDPTVVDTCLELFGSGDFQFDV